LPYVLRCPCHPESDPIHTAELQVGTIPANIAYYGGYELAKCYLEREQDTEPSCTQPLTALTRSTHHCRAADGTFWRDAAVGAAAQLLAGVVYTPIDIIKERLQVWHRGADANACCGE
jgi:hypothetical protein